LAVGYVCQWSHLAGGSNTRPNSSDGQHSFTSTEQDKDNDKDNELDFMKINLGTCPINEKISRNFTEFIQIDEKQSK
jgi:hypothetical protein